jgi:hypothetical protein
MLRRSLAFAVFLVFAPFASAAPPVLSYLFPAGGQRGTTVPLRVGGLFLHDRSHFEIDGLKHTSELKPLPRIWFEGPILPLPESQQSEDYPVDRGTKLEIAKDAPRGPHRARVWTSQGANSGPAFVVGDLPEVVEVEIDGDPIPESVKLPVTANGRIFPREDIDLWSFAAKKGESITAFASVAEIRSPVVPQIEIVDANGRVLAETAYRLGAGRNEWVRFTAPTDGTYSVRLRDARNGGGLAHIYRLTITAGTVVDRVFPLGGRRGTTMKLELAGQAIPKPIVEIAIPTDAPADFHPALAGANDVRIDVDDLPEFVGPTAAEISAPAALNGRVGEPGIPNAWRLNLKKGIKYEFELLARSLGSRICGAIIIRDSLGRELARAESPDPTTDPLHSFVPPTDGVYSVEIVERFRPQMGDDYRYRLKVRPATTLKPGVRLTVASDIVAIPRGTTTKLKLSAERTGGFAGPISLRLQGLPAGITATAPTIGEKQTSAEIVLTADPLAKVQLARVNIVGTTSLGTHAATANGTDTLLVLATVPTPFKFTGEYTMGNAPRGQPYSRNYKLERNGFEGPITVSLADRQIRHLQGATGDPLVVRPGASEFTYKAKLPAWIETGRTCRVTLMAVGRVRDPDGTEHVVAFTSTEQNHQMIVVPEPGWLGIESRLDAIRSVSGGSVRVPVRVVRASGLGGKAKVSFVQPAHWRGVSVESIEIPADREHGELTIRFASGDLGPFNKTAIIRAEVGDAVAETSIELLPPRARRTGN